MSPVGRYPKRHGRRFTDARKKEVLEYAKTHTWAATAKKFHTSEQSIARWKK